MRRTKNKNKNRVFKKTCLLSTAGALSAQNSPFVHRVEKLISSCAETDIPTAELCRLAGVRVRQFYRWQSGKAIPRPSSLRRMERALMRLLRQREQAERGEQVLAPVAYRMVLVALADRAGLNVTAVLADDPRGQDKQSPFKHSASLCRQRALYLIVTEMNVPLVAAAGLAGVSKQAVSKGLRVIEESRDEPAINDLLEEVADLIHGGANG